MSASNIIHTLWSSAEANTLSDEQLAKLSCSDELSRGLSDVSAVMMGIGCLIAEEGSNGSKTGTFQEPDSIAQLLWTLSDVVDTAAAASFVASGAKTLLHARKQSGARNEKKPMKATS